MAYVKADLVSALHEKLGLSKSEAKNMIEVFIEEIKKALERGEKVKFSGFGNFVTRKKNPRPGRNPRTGEPVEISERTVVLFKAGPKLLTLISQYAARQREQ